MCSAWNSTHFEYPHDTIIKTNIFYHFPIFRGFNDFPRKNYFFRNQRQIVSMLEKEHFKLAPCRWSKVLPKKLRLSTKLWQIGSVFFIPKLHLTQLTAGLLFINCRASESPCRWQLFSRIITPVHQRECGVRCKVSVTDCFDTSIGLSQACIGSPTMFCLFVNVCKSATAGAVWRGGRRNGRSGY